MPGDQHVAAEQPHLAAIVADPMTEGEVGRQQDDAAALAQAQAGSGVDRVDPEGLVEAALPRGGDTRHRVPVWITSCVVGRPWTYVTDRPPPAGIVDAPGRHGTDRPRAE